MSRTARIAAVGAVLAVLLVALTAHLLRTEPRYSGFNSVRPTFPVVDLAPQDLVCQSTLLPGDTAAIEVVVHVVEQPTPPLEVEVRRPVAEAPGASPARGRVDGGYGEGLLSIPFTPVVDASRPVARVCIRNQGRANVQLVGTSIAGEGFAVNGAPQPQLLTLNFRRPGSESTAGMLSTIAQRMTVARAGFVEGWTFWLLAAIFLGASAVAIALVLGKDFGREDRS